MPHDNIFGAPVPMQNDPIDKRKEKLDEFVLLLQKMGEKIACLVLDQSISIACVQLGQPYQSGSATSQIEGTSDVIADVPVSVEKSILAETDPIKRAELRAKHKSIVRDLSQNLMKIGG